MKKQAQQKSKLTLYALSFVFALMVRAAFSPQTAFAANCGDTYSTANPQTCRCDNGEHSLGYVSGVGTMMCCGWVSSDGNTCLASDPLVGQCGDTYATSANKTCSCESGTQSMGYVSGVGTMVCCGWLSEDGNSCQSYEGLYDPEVGVTNEVLDSFNPLNIGGSDSGDPTVMEKSANALELSTIGGILTSLLRFAFPLAGFILFIMLVWGGFEILTGATNKKNLDAGKQRVAAAVIGFLLLFASYWIAQLVEQVLKVNIL